MSDTNEIEPILSEDNAQKLLRKNISNIVKKAADGKSLNAEEIKLIELNSPQKEKQIIHRNSTHTEKSRWEELELQFIKGVGVQKLSEFYKIPYTTIAMYSTRHKWTQKRESFYKKIVEKSKKEIAAQFENRILNYFEDEFEDMLQYRLRVNDGLTKVKSEDMDGLLKAVTARLKCHELGRKALKIESDNSESDKPINNLTIIQQLLQVREVVASKQFDPLTIDADDLAKVEIVD